MLSGKVPGKTRMGYTIELIGWTGRPNDDPTVLEMVPTKPTTIERAIKTARAHLAKAIGRLSPPPVAYQIRDGSGKVVVRSWEAYGLMTKDL
jgi:hypothetical protein